MNPNAARALAYLIAAVVLGAITATAQGFGIGEARWFGAAAGGPVLGLALAVLGSFVTHPSVPRWMFWSAVVVLGVTVAGAECAMCVFVP